MAGVRPNQIPGLPANCSDMSDMLVCLVTPHCNKGWANSPLEHRAQVARRDMRRDGAPDSRPRVHPQTFFQSHPYFLPPPSSYSKPSVYLILLQFHLSPPKTLNQHLLDTLRNSHTPIPLCIFPTEVPPPPFFSSPDLSC